MAGRLRLDPYILALMGMVLLASLAPIHGQTAAAFSLFTKGAIALLFFLHGAKLSRAAVIAGVTQWRLHLVVLAVTFGAFPLLGLAAQHLPDAIPEEEKGRRLARVIDHQREIQRATNEALVGQTFEALVDGASRRPGQWSGRCSSNRILNFTSPRENLLGEYVQVRVTSASPNCLVGEQVI